MADAIEQCAIEAGERSPEGVSSHTMLGDMWDSRISALRAKPGNVAPSDCEWISFSRGGQGYCACGKLGSQSNTVPYAAYEAHLAGNPENPQSVAPSERDAVIEEAKNVVAYFFDTHKGEIQTEPFCEILLGRLEALRAKSGNVESLPSAASGDEGRQNAMDCLENYLQPQWETARAELAEDGNYGWSSVAIRAITMRDAIEPEG
jgi:hypothetical protein